jgi:hypothetical protein
MQLQWTLKPGCESCKTPSYATFGQSIQVPFCELQRTMLWPWNITSFVINNIKAINKEKMLHIILGCWKGIKLDWFLIRTHSKSFLYRSLDDPCIFVILMTLQVFEAYTHKNCVVACSKPTYIEHHTLSKRVYMYTWNLKIAIAWRLEGKGKACIVLY